MGDTAKTLLKRAKPFTENTLWRFLNCFVNGVSVMEHGEEATYDELTRESEVEPKDNWEAICHFDLKPANS